ncbi:unnamed protein product, partial [Staurois parvus]
IGAVHRELACFQVISSPRYSVVLGYPWLQKHNPTFNWRVGRDSLVGLHSVGPVAIRCLFGLHHFRCGIFHGPSEGFFWRFCSGLVPVVFGPIQRFLGFSNYYRKFIRNFSTLAK